MNSIKRISAGYPSWQVIQNLAHSMRIPCSSVQFRVRSTMEYKNIKGTRNPAIPARFVYGECIQPEPQKYPDSLSILYSLSTRVINRIWTCLDQNVGENYFFSKKIQTLNYLFDQNWNLRQSSPTSTVACHVATKKPFPTCSQEKQFFFLGRLVLTISCSDPTSSSKADKSWTLSWPARLQESPRHSVDARMQSRCCEVVTRTPVRRGSKNSQPMSQLREKTRNLKITFSKLLCSRINRKLNSSSTHITLRPLERPEPQSKLILRLNWKQNPKLE